LVSWGPSHVFSSSERNETGCNQIVSLVFIFRSVMHASSQDLDNQIPKPPIPSILHMDYCTGHA
jgi:hypothetical protein